MACSVSGNGSYPRFITAYRTQERDVCGITSINIGRTVVTISHNAPHSFRRKSLPSNVGIGRVTGYHITTGIVSDDTSQTGTRF